MAPIDDQCLRERKLQPAAAIMHPVRREVRVLLIEPADEISRALWLLNTTVADREKQIPLLRSQVVGVCRSQL
jgi:hypothetical protein